MGIFLLKKPDNSESLVYIKHAQSIDEAYPILKNSPSLNGCGITVSAPDLESLDAWESILKKCGFPDLDTVLSGLSDEDRLDKVMYLVREHSLLAKQYAYDYKLSAQLDHEPFQSLNSRQLVDQLKSGVDESFTQAYDAVDNRTQIGQDSSGKVKMILHGRVTTVTDTDPDFLRDQILGITSANLDKLSIRPLDQPSVTVSRAGVDGTELKMKRRLKFRF